jgi:hypothetical protein
MLQQLLQLGKPLQLLHWATLASAAAAAPAALAVLARRAVHPAALKFC